MSKTKHLCIYIVIGENQDYEEAGIFEATDTNDLCRQMLEKHYERHDFSVEKFLMVRHDETPLE